MLDFVRKAGMTIVLAKCSLMVDHRNGVVEVQLIPSRPIMAHSNIPLLICVIQEAGALQHDAAP